MEKEILTKYEKTWKKILENDLGEIDKEQLMKELYDFSNMIDRVTKLTSLISNGELSYPTYDVDVLYRKLQETLVEEFNRGYELGVDDTENKYGVGQYEESAQ